MSHEYIDTENTNKYMLISEMAFNVVVDDVLVECKMHKMVQRERNEVLAIL